MEDDQLISACLGLSQFQHGKNHIPGNLSVPGQLRWLVPLPGRAQASWSLRGKQNRLCGSSRLRDDEPCLGMGIAKEVLCHLHTCVSSQLQSTVLSLADKVPLDLQEFTCLVSWKHGAQSTVGRVMRGVTRKLGRISRLEQL